MYSEILKQSAPSPKSYPFNFKELNGFVESSDRDNGSEGQVHRNILLYIDHSNIFETAKKHSAKLKKYLPGLMDVTCRIDVGKLVCKAVGNRRLLFGKLYGSEPPALDTVWDAIRKKDVEVKTFVRSKWTNKEKEVDGGLIADAVEDIVEQKEIAGINRTLILFSGDRDLNQVVNKAVKHEYFVEIWAFKSSLNRDVINRQRENPNHIRINYIDDVFKQITFTNYTWGDQPFPRERSLVAFLSISEYNASQRGAIFKDFVKKACEIFRMPMTGKFINNCEHLVLIPFLKEFRGTPRFQTPPPSGPPTEQPNPQFFQGPKSNTTNYGANASSSTDRLSGRSYPTTYAAPFPARSHQNQIPQLGYGYYPADHLRGSGGPMFPLPVAFPSQNTRSYFDRQVGVGGHPRLYPGFSVQSFAGPQIRPYLGPSMRPHFNQNGAFFTGPNTRPFPSANAGPYPGAHTGPFPSTYTGPYPGTSAGPHPGTYAGRFPGSNTGTFERPTVGLYQSYTTGPIRVPSSRPQSVPNTATSLNSSSDDSVPNPTSQVQTTAVNGERNYDFYIHIQPNIPRLRECFKNICPLILPWNEFIAHDRPRPQNARESILSPYRFEQLQINDKEDNDDEKLEVKQNLESISGCSPISSESDFFEMSSTNGDFTPMVRKSKPKRILYSGYCIYKFWCRKGKLCSYKHLAEERDFFELYKNEKQRVMYKTRPCYSKVCKYNDKPYLCPYAHSLEESRCLSCRGEGNGKHWMEECPDKKD